MFIFLSLFFAFPAEAANINLSEKYSLPPSEQNSGNLYVASQSAIVSGDVTGDAVFLSGEVTFSGEVLQDTLFIGGTVESLGLVKGDLRALGGRVSVGGPTDGDVVIIGGSVQILPDSYIQGDVIIIGGNISIEGEVGGNVYIAGGNVLVTGKINGNAKVYSTVKIEIGSGAVIRGDVVYYSGAEAEINSSAQVFGGVKHEFSAPLISASDIKGFVSSLFGWFFLVRILITLASVLIFVLVFRRLSAELVKLSVEKFWRTSLFGFITIIAIPFASVFLAITILGSAIGAVLFMVGITMAVIAKIYAGVIFGYLCAKYLFKEELPEILSWKKAIVGALAAHIVFLIPFYIGFAAWFLLFINAFGAVSCLAYKHFFTSR